MKDYKYIKSIIGYLIGYYRKESNKSANDFVLDNSNYYKEYCLECNKCDYQNQICSVATLYRLEKGHVVYNDCVYIRLANNLNKKVILDNYDIYNYIESIRIELKNTLIDFSKTRLEKIEANIEFYLQKYKNVLYVEEILSLYLSVVKNALYGIDLDKIEGKVFLFLRDKIQIEDDKMITFLLYKTSFRILDLYATMEVINEQCSKFYDDLLFYKPKLNSITYTNLLYILDGYCYLINNELTKIKNLTKYQQYQLYCEIGNVELNLEAYEKSYQTFDKCIKLLKTFDSTNDMKCDVYIYKGRVCYILGKYNETIKCLQTARKITKSKSIGFDTLFLFSALEKNNQINSLKELINDINVEKMKSKYSRKIVAYYILKYSSNFSNSKDIVELENFILDLKPTLDIYGPLHKNVFEEDLKYYVTITGNYKKYHYFNV